MASFFQLCGFAILLAGCSFPNPHYQNPTTEASTTVMSSTSDWPTTVSTTRWSTSMGSGETTASPTTVNPTTESPTTTTVNPTTEDPTTTTVNPTTEDPTTTTVNPTTEDPPTSGTVEPESESESESESETGNDLCNEPVVSSFKIQVTNPDNLPALGPCNTSHIATGLPVWLNETTLQLNSCNNECQVCDGPSFKIEVLADDLDDDLRLYVDNYNVDGCIQYELSYDKSFQGLCKVGGLALSDEDFYWRYVATAGRVAPPISTDDSILVEPVLPDECNNCDQPCCNDIEPPPGDWFLLFHGMAFEDNLLLAEGEKVDVPEFTYPTKIQNIRSFVPAICAPTPISWVISSLPVQ